MNWPLVAKSGHVTKFGPEKMVNDGVGAERLGPNSKERTMVIQPIKLKDLVMIMGEDFELIIDRAMNPTAPGVKIANFLAQMTSEEATTLMLGLTHLNPDGNLPPLPVDEKAELSEMDDLDAVLDEIDG